ncbi:uncharacterized protein HRG_11002 [Hirsutella rhossiliensis]|uniref:Nascent polypeptide-associated complex subunit alpha-like UBA domain-containing protein n=1 Tax=Hirsutella rhossiliensis TaxID=111463 RepID=A0A9P8MMU0_9HYPO|nr:uncharacterized protein HRG_11002 [Hirsutella rhossiliensis]KAH0957909.1 hypothetical protein HRG_11002 [Hirsutella rhossiliensis]
MADNRPPADVDDELPASSTAKSAEDRKAASALASLDASHDDAAATASKHVDRRAVDEAMKRLGGVVPSSSSSAAAAASSKAKAAAAASPVKNVKVDAADVALVVDQLELPRPKATELLKAHDGDAVKAMRAYISA